MGLTFAKSVKFGAIRFNFSGSGIGMSVGIPGLRIGSGPRGAYISGGAGGFRYRKSLGSAGPRRVPAAPVPHMATTPDAATVDSPNIASSIEHETKNVLELRDSSSDALLQSMNEQRKKMSLWPFVGGGLMFAISMLNGAAPLLPDGVIVLALFAAVLLTAWTAWRDRLRKVTVLFFAPDEPTNQLFEALAVGLKGAASARKLKSVANTARYSDTKYSAGASQGLKFAAASFLLGQAPGVVANVQVPLLKAGKTTLAFYPDRVLAFQGGSVGAIDYGNLQVLSSTTRYIETEGVPSDARIVDKTWQYVNKSGGPDKRFKNNKELPICAYNRLHLSTSDGLDVRFLGSKEGGFDALARAVESLQKRL